MSADTTDVDAARKGRTRATALPPDERRAALIEATAPLVLAYGRDVTTRQIAEAAAVAEGTIFRAFPDKDSLIDAAIAHLMDPGPTEALLAMVDPSLPIEARLLPVTEILQTRVRDIWALNEMISGGPGVPRPSRDARLRGIAALLEPDLDRIHTDPLTAAQALVGLAFAGTHPSLCGDKPMTADEIVSMFLHGVLGPDA